MDALLRLALDPACTPPAVDQLAAWWAATAAARDAWSTPFDRAFAGGVYADRLGFAFAAGYAAALHALVPALAPGSIAALCATEDGGNHPRAIRTRLVARAPGHATLTGRKKWASLATAASSLLVVASTGEHDGKNQLRVVRVRSDAAGVRLHPSSAPFVPEIPHAEVELDGVIVDDADVLPGDGYDDYLKPFRTIEDLHVHGAIAGYLIGVARRKQFPRELQERLLVLALATGALAAADPKAATTHAALAGVLDLAHRLVGELELLWAAAPDDEWTRWQRDRPLLRVAGTARAARRDRAWATLDATP
ncbi:MAG: acyl-CoA dehydrogenase family protein [Kofleriaceae bacterium]